MEPSQMFHHLRSCFLRFAEGLSWFSIPSPRTTLVFFINFITAVLVQKRNWVMNYPDRVLVFLPVWFLIPKKLIFPVATYKTRAKGNLRKIIQNANASMNYLRTNNRLTLPLGIMFPAFLSIEIRGTSNIKSHQSNSKNVTKRTFSNVYINYWTHSKVTKFTVTGCQAPFSTHMRHLMRLWSGHDWLFT